MPKTITVPIGEDTYTIPVASLADIPIMLDHFGIEDDDRHGQSASDLLHQELYEMEYSEMVTEVAHVIELYPRDFDLLLASCAD